MRNETTPHGKFTSHRLPFLTSNFSILNSVIILSTTEDGRSQIKLRAKYETVWLTQLEMAELFASSKQNIGQHLKSIFEEGELMEASVVKQHFTTAADGKNSPLFSTRPIKSWPSSQLS